MTANNRFYLRMETNGCMLFKQLSDADLLDQIRDELDGGFFEIVRLPKLSYKYLMLVDDCGILKGLPVNPLASELYGVRQHGQPIVGTALIMREDYVDGEPDIVGLTAEECSELTGHLKRIFMIREA